MEGKLSNLIESNFGKAAFYTPEENARYGGVNLNCCERILRGANIAYGLGMREEDLRVSAAFGGGMGIGITCGALVGALMVLSMKYSGPAEKTTALKEEITAPFLMRMREELGGLDCSFLKPRVPRQQPFDSTPIVLAVAKALDETVERLDAQK